MKKLTSLFLSLILILSTVPAVFADGDSIFAGGTGTAADPYIISTAEQFAAFADSVNNGTNYSGQYIKLANDINLGESTTLQIGHICDDCVSGNLGNGETRRFNIHDASRYFSGIFDGNGYSITYNYVGESIAGALFAAVYGVTVTDEESGVATTTRAGIKNLTVNGSRQATKWLGGIVGFGQNVDIENCISNVNLKCNSFECKGGIAGELSYANVINCINNGTLDLSYSKNYNGGIVGDVWESTISDCINNGTINISSPNKDADQYTGGIVGQIAGDRGTIVSRCINNGDITLDGNATADYYDRKLRFVGGIVGATRWSKTEIYDCVNTGCFDYGYAGDIGGIIGKMLASNDAKDNIVKNCYNTGDGACAGIAGYICPYATIENCYTLGTHTADNIAISYAELENGFIEITNVYVIEELPVENRYGLIQKSADTITADMLNGETDTSWVDGDNIPELKTLAAARPGYLLADRKDDDALDVRLFALFANEHNYTTGEDGKVTTNSLDLADQIAIVAVYDSEGKLIQAQRAGKIANETIFVNFEDVPGAASVSLFIWDDINVKNPVAFSNVLTTTLPVVSDEPAAE